MKNRELLLFLLLTVCGSSCGIDRADNRTPMARLSKEYDYRKDNDSTAWDMVKFNRSAEYAGRLAQKNMPLTIGVFPTSPYESAGNGSIVLDTTVNDKRMIGHSVYLVRDAHNEARMRAGEDYETYFTILLVTEEGGELENTGFVSSNNHPTYAAEGSIFNDNYSVDWVAIINDSQATGLVNMRYFDLSYGNLVLVKVLPDLTIRLFQADSKYTSEGKIDLASSLQDTEVQQFVGKE